MRTNGYPYLSWQYPAEQLGASKAAANISTPKIKRIAAATATIYIAPTSKGAPAATQYGLCWNNTGMPTTADSKSTLGTIASFDTVQTSIASLAPNTLYHVRSYATNADGTTYSQEITFVYVPTLAGSGTKASPFLINNLYDLFWLEEQCNIHDSVYVKKYFKQTANIDLTVSSKINNSKGWDGIQHFSGQYDGDFHTIDGLYINRPQENMQGLWSDMGMYGKISNLGVTNANVTAGTDVGVLAGLPRFDTIVNCYATGTVHGYTEVGGLVGYLHYTVALWSFSAVDVWGERVVGGFVGRNFNPSKVSNNCYSRGLVTRTTGNDVNIGSICGMSNGSISYSYATGKVSYANKPGEPSNKGFISGGTKYTPTNNYFDTQTTGQNSDTLGAAAAMPTAYMKQQGMYSGWQFATNTTPYWKIDATRNDGYPYFWWQTFPNTPIVTTNPTTAITVSSATANGELKSLGASAITAYGFCWNTTGNPTTADSKKDLGTTSTLGAFSANLTGLNPCTTYYLRAFASNSEGTTYGAQLSFNLLDTQKPTISWDKGIQYIAANTALPNYTALATVTDNCDIGKLTITQTPSANSIISSFPQTVSLTATDAAGNSAQTTLLVNEQLSTQTIDLNEGWNLVSLYVHPQDSTIETLFAGLDLIEAKDMSSYWRKAQSAEFNTLSRLSVGKGYMVNLKTGGKLSVLGTAHQGTLPSYTPSINWELCAIPSSTVQPLSSFFNNVNGTLVKDLKGYWQNNATGSTIQNIEPGAALFMKLNK